MPSGSATSTASGSTRPSNCCTASSRKSTTNSAGRSANVTPAFRSTRWIHTSRSRRNGTVEAGMTAPLGAVTSDRHECAGSSRQAVSKR
ncbi:hypothetical protein BBK82_24400 [Lentzea guizhouensis]|uniref:Uncharacterized protein n=1 Tax=Lentzea guizhouensis TaxID=1586287 RepID=A0A1B2HM03_9PSEU|nr:hypothetical protein BBK82_24400 [Lentzea guizhouensis]